MRSILDRLPFAWRIPAVRSVAVLVAVSTYLLLGVLLLLNLDSHNFTIVLDIAFGFVMALPLAALQPWTRLARLGGQPLVPTHAAVPLLAPDIVHLRQRDLLCRALAWSAALSLATLAITTLPAWLHARLLNTPLEGGGMGLSVALAVLALAVIGGWGQGLPRRWAQGRLAGDTEGWVASEALALGANLMVVLALALLVYTWWPTDRNPMTFWVGDPMLVLASAMGWWWWYARLLHACAPPATVSEPLWLAVLPPAAADESARTDLRTLLALAHHIAGEWRIGPVSVLLPASAHAGGEHLLAAEAAGRRDVLFPTLPVQWRDWQRLQPPAARWSSLPLRELHLQDGTMLAAARELVPTGAPLVVLAAPGAAADLPAWETLLRDRPGTLCRTGDVAADGTATVARAERRSATLRKAALRVLEPLRPRAEQAAVGDVAVDAAVDAAAPPAAATGPAPALPSIIHPGRFALGAVAWLVAVLAVYMAMAVDVQRAGDEAFSAIRGVPALRTPPDAVAAPAAASAAAK